MSEIYLGNIMGPPGPKGETPDLSDYVKFVNGVGPDENGNVIIAGETEHEGFKVYRVKDGVKSTSSTGTTITYNLTDECKNTIKTMIFNFLNGEKNGMLIIDTKGVSRTPDSFCFIINESSISDNYIYFQSLISPSDYKADYVGGDYSCRISIYYYQLYVVLNTNRDDISTYTCKGLESILNAVPTTQYLQQTSYTITGLHTYNKLPQSSVEPTDDKDLVNKAYVDSLGGGGASGDSGVVTLTTDVINSLLEEYGITTLTWGALYLKYGGGVFYVPQNFTFMLNGGYSTTLTKGSTIMLFGSGFSGIIFHGAPANVNKCISFHYDNGSKITASASMSYFTYVENFRSNPYHQALAKLNYLAKDNTTAYTPTQSYHPATKQYVDNLVGDIESLLSEV